MGAWGTGSFENDDAMDFIGELRTMDTGDLAAIFAAFEKHNSYLDAPQCSVGIAAAEVVAAAKDSPSPEAPPELAEWVKEHKARIGPEHHVFALGALSRIRTDSELKELWEESEELEQWYERLDELAKRLAPR